MEKRKIIVGSRESKLAVDQTKLVMEAIKEANPDIELELVTMKTTGDKILDKTLDKIGGKGLFVKELDKALLEKKVDITIHSLKDMPMEVDENLPLLAFFKRGNPYDALVLPKDKKDKSEFIRPIGSSSARRNIQLKEIYKECENKPVRGNVLTRLEKLDSGEFGSLVLACAGLERLKLEDRISKVFTHKEMIPAAGQGILVIQGRKGEDYSFLEAVDDKFARSEATAERAFVRTLDGGCSAPIGAFAIDDGIDIEIFGLYVNTETMKYKKGSIKGRREKGEELAVKLANQLKEEVDNDNCK